MTHHSTSGTAGQDAGPISIGLSKAISPAEFVSACAEIVTQQDGHAAHRELDQLVTDLLTSLGYGDGMAVFLAHVAPLHAPDLPDDTPKNWHTVADVARTIAHTQGVQAA